MKKVPCHKKRGIFETLLTGLEYYVGHAVNSTFVISFVKFVKNSDLIAIGNKTFKIKAFTRNNQRKLSKKAESEHLLD